LRSDPLILSLIVAVAENGLIGRDGDLPWRIPADLKFFKNTTMGKPIVMGRKTWQSIGRPLPGRANIVITRDRQWSHEGVLTCHELNEALERAFEQALIDGADAVMVVGGAEIYRLALSRADKVILTRVHDEIIGDVRFDLEVFADWRQLSLSRYEAVEGNSHAFSIEELEAP